MPQDYAEEASAASNVGTDMMVGHRFERTPYMRILDRVALTGSSSAGDMEVEIYIGDRYVGRVNNNRTGTVILDEADWKGIGAKILPNEKLMVRISDSGATNVGRFHFITVP